MGKTKAIIDFTDYTGADLLPVSQTIHDKMTENAATFPDPDIPMATLQAGITTFREALVATASRAIADTLACKAARKALEAMLAGLGAYVNGIAKGDPIIVEQSGFPAYTTGRTNSSALPGAPQNLRLSHGTLSGTILARYRAQGQRSMNEVQTCTGNPNVEANWQHAGVFSNGRALIRGLPVGSTIWVRIRTAGPGGAMGAWSDPGKIVVI